MKEILITLLIVVFSSCRTSEQQANDKKIQDIQNQRKVVEKELKSIERKKEKAYILMEK